MRARAGVRSISRPRARKEAHTNSDKRNFLGELHSLLIEMSEKNERHERALMGLKNCERDHEDEYFKMSASATNFDELTEALL